MKTFWFVILNILLSTNIHLIFLAVMFFALCFFTTDMSWYLLTAILLVFLINHFVKITIFPTIYTLCAKKDSKCLNFWNKLINNKDYKKETLILAGTLDLVALILCCLAFESLGFLIFILMGCGVLTSYIWFFIWYKSYNTKRQKIFSNIYKGMVCIFVILTLLLVVLAYCDRVSFDDITKYDKMHKKVKSYYDITHFPEKLPSNATDYYFEFEDSFRGYNNYYVKFSTSGDYITAEKDKFKTQCKILTDKNHFRDIRPRAMSLEIENADETCFLSTSSYGDKYTSGISIYNDTNTIYYFFANY